jgi:hypothetical protein
VANHSFSFPNVGDKTGTNFRALLLKFPVLPFFGKDIF